MAERKWRWPEEGAKRYFHKKTSKFWREKVEQEQLDPDQVSRRFRQFCK
jgi:hypothetical protein